MPHKPRVLVVYKKGAYEQCIQERQDLHLLRLLRSAHPDVAAMKRAHEVHKEAMDAVVDSLRSLDVEFDLANRATLKVTKRYDLVVSVGGDGTFLQAARCISKTPILGVNSDLERSEAAFCAATSRTFIKLCKAALEGKLKYMRLYRLELRLNGKILPYYAVNDILLAHDDPAIMTRYRLRIGRRQEVHKNSGLWVATAAGSSSAVLAAGGVELPWGAKRFQYRPRELYWGRLSRYRLTGGVLSPASVIRITWLMRRGHIYVDGPHLKIPLKFADKLAIRLSLKNYIYVLGLNK